MRFKRKQRQHEHRQHDRRERRRHELPQHLEHQQGLQQQERLQHAIQPQGLKAHGPAQSARVRRSRAHLLHGCDTEGPWAAAEGEQQWPAATTTTTRSAPEPEVTTERVPGVERLETMQEA